MAPADSGLPRQPRLFPHDHRRVNRKTVDQERYIASMVLIRQDTSMASFRIPDDLVQLLSQRRIIPFIGAGFSAVHNVPTWEDLLSSLVAEIQASTDVEPVLSYAEIAEACGHDNLQIAEYLYLIAGESIGPIRHGLSTSLQSTTPLLESTPHVELANLGAPHVYTTNFDDLIEKTYRELGLQVDVISVPRDMALSHADRTEVVKYHGDLRHEQTLVLTESQYYTRLEFESPMDLKFRSDLLGRSVLFMGYSFRDINIRVIWFRLMEMMKDVPLKDRPPSYIVRLRANPVLDELYGAVGLRTLVIDPDAEATTADAQNSLLSDFLMELAIRSSPDGTIPGSDRRAYLSVGLVQQVESHLAGVIEESEATRPRVVQTPEGPRFVRRPHATGEIVAPTPLLAAIDRLKTRHITDAIAGRVADLLLELARHVNTVGSRSSLGAELAWWYIPERGPSEGVTLMVARSLLRNSSRTPLVALGDELWAKVWRVSLPASDLGLILEGIQSEVEGHEEGGGYTDDDIAFAVDLAKRIAEYELLDEKSEDADEARARAEELVSRATVVYPAVKDYQPPSEGAPKPSEIQAAIKSRVESLEAAEQETAKTGEE